MSGRVLGRVELLEDGRMENMIGRRQGGEDIVACGPEEGADRGGSTDCGKLGEIADDAHGDEELQEGLVVTSRARVLRGISSMIPSIISYGRMSSPEP